jgi:hypothetical protein
MSAEAGILKGMYKKAEGYYTSGLQIYKYLTSFPCRSIVQTPLGPL